MILLLALEAEVGQTGEPIFAKPGCQSMCGNIDIPFPFGIGTGCFLNSWFKIDCNNTYPLSNGSQFKPFLSKLGIEVMEFNRGYLSSFKVGMPPLNVCSTDAQSHKLGSIDLRGSPYEYSAGNDLVMQGCAGSAILTDITHETAAGCATICQANNSRMPTNSCYGVRCCQTPVSSSSDHLEFYNIEFNRQLDDDQNQGCLAASLVGSVYVDQYIEKMSSSDAYSVAPVQLLWRWVSKEQPDHIPNARCTRGSDKFCECKSGYYGNPYLENGCQVPKECKHCLGICSIRGYTRSDTKYNDKYYCERSPAVMIGLIVGLCFLVSVIGCCILYRFIKRRREMQRRAKLFKRNGGLLLQQRLLTNQGVVERTKVFTVGDLDKATNHFNEDRVLGQGGQGTVYKGMLSDGSIVAIKKSKLLDKAQLEQFINEVVIVSQISHRNVVQLMRCCLQTEIPLLVYEFVPNGTLYQHIHDPDEDFVLNWEMSLRIAAESASAIAYLHSSSATPIYHRDIKSSNILLDEKYRAKVSDFGCSKTFAIDETHLTTLVQGTLGYLDPEYFQTFQFTEKSDVYSFGVVLLELITRKKPIYKTAESMEQKNLVTEFVFFMQNSKLCDILDLDITRDAKEDELAAVVDLAKRCVSWTGKSRPKMKEVARTLELIIKSSSVVATKEKVTLDRGKKVIIDVDID